MQLVAHTNFRRAVPGAEASAIRPGRGQRPWIQQVGSWAVRPDGTGLYHPGLGGVDRLVVDTGSGDGMVEGYVKYGSAHNCGICWRTSPTTMLRMVMDTSAVYFQRVVGTGSFSNIASQWSHGTYSEGLMRVVFDGPDHRCYFNDVPIRTFSYSTDVANTTHGCHLRIDSAQRIERLSVWAPDPAQRRAQLPAELRRNRARLLMP